MQRLRDNLRARRLIASFAFCAVLAINLVFTTAILRPGSAWTGGAQWPAYEALDENSVDVLVFGASHAFCGVDPAVIWRARGVPSFVHGGPTQMLQVTEYYMREALRTQTPKVIALEMTSSSYSMRTFSAVFHVTNLAAMPWTANKAEAILKTTPEELRPGMLVSLWYYHARWPELRPRDLQLLEKSRGAPYLKGFHPRYESQEVTAQPYVRPAEDYPVADAGIAYNREALDRIAQLCADEGIDLLLFLTPTGAPQTYSYYLEQSAAPLLAKYDNVRVLDLSVPGAVPGLSYVTDFYDPGHLNWRGAEKTSAVLADYLADTYELPTRASDPGYDSWYRDATLHDAHIARGEQAMADE